MNSIAPNTPIPIMCEALKSLAIRGVWDMMSNTLPNIQYFNITRLKLFGLAQEIGFRREVTPPYDNYCARTWHLYFFLNSVNDTNQGADEILDNLFGKNKPLVWVFVDPNDKRLIHYYLFCDKYWEPVPLEKEPPADFAKLGMCRINDYKPTAKQ